MNQRMHMINSLAIMCVVVLIHPDIMAFGIPLGTLIPDLDIHLQRFGLGRHRKTLHNIWLPIVFAFIGLLRSESFFVFLAIGIGVHLLADLPSRSGVYLLYPLLPKFKTVGVISFSQPSGGKNEIERIENRLKTLTAKIIFLSFTFVEIILLIAFRSWVRGILIVFTS